MKRILLSFAFVAVVFCAPSAAHAGLSDNIVGWSWGGTPSTDNSYQGIGWVSMNNLDCDTNGDNTIDNPSCGSGSIATYGISIPAIDGLVTGTGYVWSEHYGWIDYRPDLHCATYVVAPQNCTSPSGDAGGVSRLGNEFRGWARIVSVAQAGNNAGGYDGWISFSSKNPGLPVAPAYGPEITKLVRRTTFPDCNTDPNCTFAWSGDLGYLEMSMAGYDGTLKICEGSFERKIGTADIPLLAGASTALSAKYGTGNCSTDPNAPSVLWVETNNPSNAINLSSTLTNPTTVSAPSFTGTPSKSEKITATYNGKTSEAMAVVSCIPRSCSFYATDTNTYCSSEARTYDDNCGASTGLSCPGTRNCDYNWKEVAP